MKIVYVFALFVSICAGNVLFPVVLYGQDSFDFTISGTPYRISLAATTGLLIGQSEEIVYNVKDYGKNTDIYLSELLWDLKPMTYLGSALSFSRSDPLSGLGAALDLSVKFGLPLKSGSMEDRDWQDPDSGQLTDFSSHDAYLERGALLLDFSGGIVIPIKSTVAVKALVSLSYMQFSWAGKDGYGDYLEFDYIKQEYGDEWERNEFNGTVITYEQAWLIISPGIGLFWTLGRALSLDFCFFISPWIYAGDEDNHLEIELADGRKTIRKQFNDYMRGGLCLEPGLDITFAPNRFFSLILHGSWRHIAGTRGDTSINGSSMLNKNEAGAGFSAFDIGLTGKFSLPLGRLRRN